MRYTDEMLNGTKSFSMYQSYYESLRMERTSSGILTVTMHTSGNAFAREGAKVIVASRREDEGEETVRLIEEAGSEGLFVRTDVSKAAEVSALVAKTAEKFGSLDIAFNNAGVEGETALLADQTEEDFDKVIGINLKGVFLSMKYEIGQMLKNNGGCIVNMSSVVGLVADPRSGIYSASKHGVVTLTKTAALNYGQQGIRVNAVTPGAIETDMIARFIASNDELKDSLIEQHPAAGRLGQTEEVAQAVLWLCSPAASFVHGQTLAVDGGWTLP